MSPSQEIFGGGIRHEFRVAGDHDSESRATLSCVVAEFAKNFGS